LAQDGIYYFYGEHWVIIFGSYITDKKNPHDLDIVVILEKKNYHKYKQLLERVKLVTPLPIHDVIQTKEDLLINVKDGNPALKTALQEGLILWGHDFIVEALHER